jgi:hypothetical protein
LAGDGLSRCSNGGEVEKRSRVDSRLATARARADIETLPVASFTVEGVPHALVAARLSAEEAIGVRHGCFCAHPYLVRLLGLSPKEVARYREEMLVGDRTKMPGAVRASAGISTTEEQIDRLLLAVARIAGGEPPIEYSQDPETGDFAPEPGTVTWHLGSRPHGSSCSPG